MPGTETASGLLAAYADALRCVVPSLRVAASVSARHAMSGAERAHGAVLKEVMKWRQVRQRVAAACSGTALSASDDDDIAAPQVRNGKVTAALSLHGIRREGSDRGHAVEQVVVKERVVKERVVKEKVVKARVDAVFRGGPRQRAGSPVSLLPLRALGGVRYRHSVCCQRPALCLVLTLRRLLSSYARCGPVMCGADMSDCALGLGSCYAMPGADTACAAICIRTRARDARYRHSVWCYPLSTRVVCESRY
eukprot:137072-Rhodomonas_salina.2